MLIYRHLAIMVYSEKLLNIIALMKCEDNHTKKLIWVLPYNCLYQNKGNNSSVTGPRSAVGNVSGNRCESDCRSRGREFNPGPVPFFRGD